MQKTHPTYTNYNITVTGKVINNLTGKVLKPILKKGIGYYCYTLYNEEGHEQITAHRLVYETFVGTIHKGMHIDHIDGNKLHNHVKNLEQVTSEENTHRYHDKQTYNSPVKNTKLSERKLDLETVKELILELREGMSNKEAGDKYGIHPRYVSLIRHRKRWGYAWKELGLESATTIPSGSRVQAKGTRSV
jgi:hypothetical protein